jgi:hypothetical protein
MTCGCDNCLKVKMLTQWSIVADQADDRQTAAAAELLLTSYIVLVETGVDVFDSLLPEETREQAVGACMQWLHDHPESLLLVPDAVGVSGYIDVAT